MKFINFMDSLLTNLTPQKLNVAKNYVKFENNYILLIKAVNFKLLLINFGYSFSETAGRADKNFQKIWSEQCRYPHKLCLRELTPRYSMRLQIPQNLLKSIFLIWKTYFQIKMIWEAYSQIKKISENSSQNKKICLAKKNFLVHSTRKFILI